MAVDEFLNLLNLVMGALVIVILAVGAFELATRRKKQ
jgi:hypothetical protein